MYDYAAQRLHYLPDQVRVLFIGESAPDPGAREARFFYHPVLRIDNLFRGPAERGPSLRHAGQGNRVELNGITPPLREVAAGRRVLLPLRLVKDRRSM